MPNITVNLSRDARHWVIQFAIDGKIDPATVFGCSEGLAPLITGLLATDAEYAAIGSGAQRDGAVRPSLITIGMPSGRVLTFALRSVQHTLADLPE